MYLVMDFVRFRVFIILGFKKIKLFRLCFFFIVVGIWGFEYLKDREDFLNIFY